MRIILRKISYATCSGKGGEVERYPLARHSFPNADLKHDNVFYRVRSQPSTITTKRTVAEL
jgi:hypothetical protein